MKLNPTLTLFILGLASRMRFGGAQSIEACPAGSTTAIFQALSPLGETAVAKVTAGLLSGDIPAMFQAICESEASEETLTSVLAGIKVVLEDCQQNDTMVMLLGAAETADITDICMHAQLCPNITAHLEGAGMCLGSLEMADPLDLCSAAENTCSCIQNQADKCPTTSKAGIFQRRLKRVYDAATNANCSDRQTCEEHYSNGGGSLSLAACPAAATLSIVQALSPLGEMTASKVIQGINNDNIPAIFQSLCEARPTESTLTSVLGQIKVALRDCHQNDSLVVLLGVAEAGDIFDICIHSSYCSNITAQLEGVGYCLMPLQGRTMDTLCSLSNTTCACIDSQAAVCSAASKSSLFQRRIKMVYSAAENAGCTNLLMCEEAYIDNGATSVMFNLASLLLILLITSL